MVTTRLPGPWIMACCEEYLSLASASATTVAPLQIEHGAVLGRLTLLGKPSTYREAIFSFFDNYFESACKGCCHHWSLNFIAFHSAAIGSKLQVESIFKLSLPMMIN